MQLVATLLLLLASALPALSLSSNVTFFFGADCSGPIVAESTGSSPGECLYLADGGSAKSISYSYVGVPIPSQLQFFASGGPNDICAGVPASTTVLDAASTGEGCANAPDGLSNVMSLPNSDADGEPGAMEHMSPSERRLVDLIQRNDASINGRLDTIIASVDQLKTNIEGIQGQLATVEGRLTAIEGRVSRLESPAHAYHMPPTAPIPSTPAPMSTSSSSGSSSSASPAPRVIDPDANANADSDPVAQASKVKDSWS
ncbi:hypothetical protein C8F01DRAFT_1292491 [Mycena amicta]|nr:hypothetical protein C8F01DRAFT_1292491 [Mycena amicta]